MIQKNWYVYTWEHIDWDWGCMADPEKCHLPGQHLPVEVIAEEVQSAFRMAGWEGDGKLQAIWLPPFVAVSDTFGLLLWHVKQSNNGTSFIASPEPLELPLLLDQNPGLGLVVPRDRVRRIPFPEHICPDCQVLRIKEALRSQRFLWSMVERATRWEIEGSELRITFPTDYRAHAEMLQARDPMERFRTVLNQVVGQPLRVCVKVENSERAASGA